MRLWIEFEVSRADPVANHAKYATTHLFHPRKPTDIFLAMVSPHVDRGRRNLAANTITLLRGIGLSAFQTSLLPHFAGEEIKRLNHLPMAELKESNVLVEPEIDRALSVSEPVVAMADRSLHFAGDLLDVILNVQRWNREIADNALRALWGKRLVTYFVYDPISGHFAPSKFCAYVLINSRSAADRVSVDTLQSKMSILHYVTLDESERRFDGRRARLHLTEKLAMPTQPLQVLPHLVELFGQWLEAHSDTIRVHPNGPIILRQPEWFR